MQIKAAMLSNSIIQMRMYYNYFNIVWLCVYILRYQFVFENFHPVTSIDPSVFQEG
jgi:hypothetical protein